MSVVKFPIADKQLREKMEQIILACLPDPLARLSERGCEPPYEIALLDEEGTAATGLIDENGEGRTGLQLDTRTPIHAYPL